MYRIIYKYKKDVCLCVFSQCKLKRENKFQQNLVHIFWNMTIQVLNQMLWLRVIYSSALVWVSIHHDANDFYWLVSWILNFRLPVFVVTSMDFELQVITVTCNINSVTREGLLYINERHRWSASRLYFFPIANKRVTKGSLVNSGSFQRQYWLYCS